MKFRAHETFFIRRGWLRKGIKNILRNPYVFVSKDVNPMDTLGIGANMVKALRYWLQAVGLSEEPSKGKRAQTLTRFGEIINNYDPYMEEIGTLWLLHYKLATNEELATSWYFFFNEFRLNEFSRDDFFVHLNNSLRIKGESVAARSIDDDFNCIISTYISRAMLSPSKFNPEENIDSPLGELGLLDIVNKKERIYKKCSPGKDLLHPLLLLAVILDQANGEKSIRISSIQNDPKNAGKVFNLDIVLLINLLYKLDLLGFLKVVRTAGLDVVELHTDLDFYSCIEEYYCRIDKVQGYHYV